MLRMSIGYDSTPDPLNSYRSDVVRMGHSGRVTWHPLRVRRPGRKITRNPAALLSLGREHEPRPYGPAQRNCGPSSNCRYVSVPTPVLPADEILTATRG